MKKSVSYCSRAAMDCDDMDDFLFPEEDLYMDQPSQPCTSKSSNQSASRRSYGAAVLSALTTTTSKENLFVMDLAKSVLTGVLTGLTAGSPGGVPGMAVGVTIAGGLVALQALRRRSATDVIKSLSPQKKTQLVGRLSRGLNRYGIKNLAADILERKDVRDVALNILSDFLSEVVGVRLAKVK